MAMGTGNARSDLIVGWTDDGVPGDTRFAGAKGEDVKDDPVAVSTGVWCGADVLNQIERLVSARGVAIFNPLDRDVDVAILDAVRRGELVVPLEVILGGDDGVSGWKGGFWAYVQIRCVKVDKEERHYCCVNTARGGVGRVRPNARGSLGRIPPGHAVKTSSRQGQEENV